MSIKTLIELAMHPRMASLLWNCMQFSVEMAEGMTENDAVLIQKMADGLEETLRECDEICDECLSWIDPENGEHR